ncbi:tRNA (guanine(10)-N(2))-dimethyltransferase [Candidatus Micrarchaeota archaeon]|nr:tRNA (guanine(10)-N(2))-dimethyltransferase [Candidatus Micrarchaeota archaeon]
MTSKTKLQKITEGKAVVWAYPEEVPGEAVFYNPRMKTNRDLSVLALKALSGRLKKKMVLDGFCASGIRGIRYAREAGLGPVAFLDTSKAAMAVCRKNVRLNKLKAAEFIQQDFDSFATSGRCFDVVELDPFGTPAPFVATAVRLLPKVGVLSVTATDLATLCGSKNKPAARRYDAQPLYVEYAHELALRIVAGHVVRQAAMQDVAAVPVFSFYQDHFAKVLFQAWRGAQAADAALEQIGVVSHCMHCGHREASRRPSCVCGKAMAVAGPLWLGDVNDDGVLSVMKKGTKDAKLHGLLDLLAGEIGLPPYFFDVHSAGRGAASPKMDDVISRLKTKGFRAARTHYSPTAVKTDAGLTQLKAAIAGSDEFVRKEKN